MPGRRLRGFTVIDLVCIAAIIAVTVALLYPVLQAAKEKDRSTICLNNLKQCAQSLKMYCDDYDATLPSSALVAASPTQAQVIEFLTAKGDPFPKPYGTPARTWPQVLQDNMRSIDCVHCPSDVPRTRVSYWYKYAMDLVWRTSPYRTKMSDYDYVSGQIAFYEHAGWHTGDAAGIRNGVKINVSFLDCHTATITIANGPTAYPAAADERSGASGIRLGEPMYYNYDNQTSTQHSGVADYVDPARYSDRF